MVLSGMYALDRGPRLKLLRNRYRGPALGCPLFFVHHRTTGLIGLYRADGSFTTHWTHAARFMFSHLILVAPPAMMSCAISVPAGLHTPVAARPSHHTALLHSHNMAEYRPYYQKGKCDKDCFPAFAATTAVMFLFFFTHFRSLAKTPALFFFALRSAAESHLVGYLTTQGKKAAGVRLIMFSPRSAAETPTSSFACPALWGEAKLWGPISLFTCTPIIPKSLFNTTKKDVCRTTILRSPRSEVYPPRRLAGGDPRVSFYEVKRRGPRFSEFVVSPVSIARGVPVPP